MNNYDNFLNRIQNEDCKINLNAEMKAQTTFRAGGKADVLVFPLNESALKNVLEKASDEKLPTFIMGNGSNLLIQDSGLNCIVIKTTMMSADIIAKDDVVSCSAGTSLSKLCMAAYENSLSGLEFAYGIPGTVGGAVYMNAGAYGGEMKDVLQSVCHITPDGKSEKLSAEELSLGYRSSFYTQHENYTISSAVFKLKPGNKEDIKAKMDELMSKRKDKQPLEYPSAGSTFKRPEGYFAGRLIEDCGLKGYRIGGAMVSEKHAGFIINPDNGTADDILNLIEYVQKTVKEKTGVTLEPEVKIIP